ncbi:uncharacterized protein PRCAT00000779001 [Priceomyces carsonii]|uniref:uncharacterized protein n=1 Tax=Priceomyces carsonii TaxID=28549 RepID=UPI002ED854CE|nr:unnamed protein product [Priceomyces carsonii]
MFLTLGLISDTPTKLNKNILSIKLNIFKFLNSLIYENSFQKKLFPPLGSAKILDLSNTLLRNGPRNCAADDLDLSLEGPNDQIEFFNNFVFTENTHDNRASTSSASTFVTSGEYHSNENTENYYSGEHIEGDEYLSNGHDQDNHGFPSYATDNQFSLYQGINSKSMMAYGHNFNMNMNMLGINNNPGNVYFNDFDNHNVKAVGQNSVYSSSHESYSSPLDEELFNKFNGGPRSHTRQNVQVAINANEQDQHTKKRKSFMDLQIPFSTASHQSLQSLQSLLYDVGKIFDDMIVKEHSKFDYPHHQEKNRFDGSFPGKRKYKKAKKMGSEGSNQSSGTSANLLSFECPHCEAKFKVKGYLTRHLKKHNSAKAFVCPFFEEPTDSTSGSKCHPTGGFSRRDTYKTHLKALHFIYPPGTKSSERNMISGRCGGCFKFFEDNCKWLESHIEPGECKGVAGIKKPKDDLLEIDGTAHHFEQHHIHR